VEWDTARRVSGPRGGAAAEGSGWSLALTPPAASATGPVSYDGRPVVGMCVHMRVCVCVCVKSERLG